MSILNGSVSLPLWFEVLQPFRTALSNNLVDQACRHTRHSLEVLADLRVRRTDILRLNTFAFFLQRTTNSFFLLCFKSRVVCLFLVVPHESPGVVKARIQLVPDQVFGKLAPTFEREAPVVGQLEVNLKLWTLRDWTAFGVGDFIQLLNRGFLVDCADERQIRSANDTHKPASTTSDQLVQRS